MTHPTPHPVRRVAWSVLAASLTLAALTLLPLLAAGTAGAQAGATTSTFPVDNREFGDIVPQPNTGVAPQDAGDPGGWLQVSLFYLMCAAVLAIVGLVWWSSRRARRRREAAGLDDAGIAAARNARGTTTSGRVSGRG